MNQHQGSNRFLLGRSSHLVVSNPPFISHEMAIWDDPPSNPSYFLSFHAHCFRSLNAFVAWCKRPKPGPKCLVECLKSPDFSLKKLEYMEWKNNSVWFFDSYFVSPCKFKEIQYTTFSAFGKILKDWKDHLHPSNPTAHHIPLHIDASSATCAVLFGGSP